MRHSLGSQYKPDAQAKEEVTRQHVPSIARFEAALARFSSGNTRRDAQARDTTKPLSIRLKLSATCIYDYIWISVHRSVPRLRVGLVSNGATPKLAIQSFIDAWNVTAVSLRATK